MKNSRFKNNQKNKGKIHKSTKIKLLKKTKNKAIYRK